MVLELVVVGFYCHAVKQSIENLVMACLFCDFVARCLMTSCAARLWQVSIVRDIKHREIRLMTDAGRTSRPLLIVENQKLLLKKQHIDLLKEKEYNQYGCLLPVPVPYLLPRTTQPLSVSCSRAPNTAILLK